jgi:hypothetical protein
MVMLVSGGSQVKVLGRTVWLVGLPVACIAPAVLVWTARTNALAQTSNPPTPGQRVATAGPAATTRPANGEGSQTRESEPGEERPATAPASSTAADDLRAKGFPPMEVHRRDAYTQTASQTTAEVAQDLGNRMVSFYCSEWIEITKGFDDLAYYFKQISCNIKVLRLIEEGRKDPQTVSALLARTIKDCLTGFDEARKAHWEAWKRNDVRGTSSDDPYYAKHRRYESPILEYWRRLDAINMCFYIMANLDRIDPQLLAGWIQTTKGLDRRCRCDDMNLWLVDRYFHQPGVTGDAAKQHRELAGDIQISGKRVRQSRWNAPWDIHDPLLAMAGANPKDIQTIEVLEIPCSPPPELDSKTKQQMLANFLAQYGAAAQSRPVGK